MGLVGRLVGVVVFLALGTIVLRSLERFFPARDASGAPLRTQLFAHSRLTDVAHVAFNELVTKRIVSVVALGVFVLFVVVFRLPREHAELLEVWHREARLQHLPMALQVPLAVVFADFAGYWAHRALHVGRLWRFHAVHHSSTALDWLAGARNHPVAEAFTTIAVGASLLVIGFDPRVLAVAAPLGLYAILLHANVPWGRSRVRYVITTPLFHRWHHAHPNALPQGMKHGVNFAGLLPLWDLLFGTFHAPARDPEIFGADEPVPARFLPQLAFPFRRRS
jgi:sterol desaturase/sphingolipid hydroxylase (fatty acid hydroxylase superfamily)